MIRYVVGNMLSADTQALVNTVNTVGVMGKGIALQFKERYPQNYAKYLAACKSGELTTGRLLVVKEKTLDEDRIIINFPTKKDWKHPSKYEYVEAGLQALRETIAKYNIRSIAIPPLGCGNGRLQWDKVQRLMEHYLGDLDNVDILIYQPNDAVKEILKKEARSKSSASLTPARAMLLYAMFYYESQGENASVFVANKLAYFLQRLGERSFSRLKFTAQSYGPYSPGVAHVLHALNGKYLTGMEQMEAKPFEPLTLQYAAAKEVSEYVKTRLRPEQRDRLRMLITLTDGFLSTLSLEILASVDYIRKEYPQISKEETISRIGTWTERKKELFKEQYIITAYDHLEKYATRIGDMI